MGGEGRARVCKAFIQCQGKGPPGVLKSLGARKDGHDLAEATTFRVRTPYTISADAEVERLKVHQPDRTSPAPLRPDR